MKYLFCFISFLFLASVGRAQNLGILNYPIGSGGGGGSVTSVTNPDGTITISPTTGAATVKLNLANGNNWTGAQTWIRPFTNTVDGQFGDAGGALFILSGQASGVGSGSPLLNVTTTTNSASNAGAYGIFTGNLESWLTFNTLQNTSPQSVRIGDTANQFSLQAGTTGNLILSVANGAPANSLNILTSGASLFGSSTDNGSGANVQVTGAISQTGVTSALLKANSSGKLVSATAGTDFDAAGSASGLLSSNNTWSGTQLFNGNVTFGSSTTITGTIQQRNGSGVYGGVLAQGELYLNTAANNNVAYYGDGSTVGGNLLGLYTTNLLTPPAISVPGTGAYSGPNLTFSTAAITATSSSGVNAQVGVLKFISGSITTAGSGVISAGSSGFYGGDATATGSAIVVGGTVQIQGGSAVATGSNSGTAGGVSIDSGGVAGTTNKTKGIITIGSQNAGQITIGNNGSGVETLVYPYQSNQFNGPYSATTSLLTWTVPGADLNGAEYRISSYLNILSASIKTVTLQVTFTDENSTVRTISIAPTGSTGLNLGAVAYYTYPCFIIFAQPASTVTVTCLVSGASGSISFDADAFADRIF